MAFFINKFFILFIVNSDLGDGAGGGYCGGIQSCVGVIAEQRAGDVTGDITVQNLTQSACVPVTGHTHNYLFGFERNYKEVYVHFVTVVQTMKSRPKENYYIEKYLQREIIKLDRLIEQQNLLCHNDIETDEQLQAFKQECINEMAEVTEARRIYRNKLKSAVHKGDEKEIAEIKDTISLFSERLKILRKDINTCERIEKSEPEIENKIDQILEIEQQQKNKTQNRNRGYSRDER